MCVHFFCINLLYVLCPFTLDLHCPSLDCQVSHSLMLRYGISVLKFLSKQHNIAEFVLFDWHSRKHLLQDMLSRLPPDERDMFTTGECTNEHGNTYPCIRLSPSSEY